jgi:hypothetical protein
MEYLLGKAVQSGHFSLIMPAFNFMKFPKATDLIKEAARSGVGVIAMKTLAGAKDMALDFKGEPFAPAAFKWVLGHPEVNGLVITIKNTSDLDLFVSASGKAPGVADKAVLDRYAKRYTGEYCRTGCNECGPACPYGVEMATIMRYHMYYSDYGMEKRAIASYSGTGRDAALCSRCNDASCNGACPYGLPLRDMLIRAHSDMTLKA